LVGENAALTRDLDLTRDDLDRRLVERGSLVKQVAHKHEVRRPPPPPPLTWVAPARVTWRLVCCTPRALRTPRSGCATPPPLLLCLQVEKSVVRTQTDLQTLRTDNARLLKLLRSTSEWSDFQKLW
jgi:hypothetical protein